jgi:hypothetical protein
MTKRIIGLIALGLFTILAILYFLHLENIVIIPETVLFSLRWAFLTAMIMYAVYKRSLTTWILVSMLIGVEIGLDFPAFSQNLRVLSQIFLRMVKTIIAPILFATLVVGIAGHSNLKQVGRMGWKSMPVAAAQRNAQPPRVKLHPLTQFVRSLPSLDVEIPRIVDNWRSKLGHVHTKLVGAAGDRFQRHPGKPACRRVGHRVMRNGVL